ncbi:hypothetical protein BDV93DRAFT_353616 [Ceratobasidium sp. AG-I]|nr:hypothetical protein BDV93DRAFT_353616 [Ceratobasidium sp. AG-I]
MDYIPKKRKLFDVDSLYRENPEKEKKVLQGLLEQADGATVIGALADGVEIASLEELRILKRLLRGAFDSFEPKLHCVRCHKAFLDSENKHGVWTSMLRSGVRKGRYDLRVGESHCVSDRRGVLWGRGFRGG